MINYPYYSTVKLLVDVGNFRQLPDYLPKLRDSIAYMVPCIDEIRRKLLPGKYGERCDNVIAEMLVEHQTARHLYTRGKRLLRGAPLGYRGYVITREPPPIPLRDHDWRFAHRDYEGPEDWRCGTAATLDECFQAIDVQIRTSEAIAARKEGAA